MAAASCPKALLTGRGALRAGGTLNYFAVPWFVVNNPLPLAAVTLIEVVLIGAAEKYRRDGTGPPGFSPGVGKFDSSIFNGMDELYPGGPFDPLKLAQAQPPPRLHTCPAVQLTCASSIRYIAGVALCAGRAAPLCASWRGHVRTAWPAACRTPRSSRSSR
jgi:Chlorophyll A-B binding protein